MRIDGRGSVVPDDTRPAGREVIADRRPNAHDRAGSGCADRDSGSETLYLEGSACQRRFGQKRSVVTTQISELGPTQRRVRAVAPVSDRADFTTAEQVPRIALTQQEACVSLGCCEELFVEPLSRHLRVARSDGKRALVEQV